MNYIEFASKISFFEFIQEEFNNPHFDISGYNEEIELLKKDINIEKLTKIFETNPKVFDIFEEILQLSRFTNTQYIHFFFDVNCLNNCPGKKIIEYADKSIFKFENNEINSEFDKIYSKHNTISKSAEYSKIYSIKKSIIEYIDKISREKELLHKHLKNSIGSRYRLAKYLIENLKADEFVRTLKLEEYLKMKRKPKDTKSIHGKYGRIKISKILENNDIVNADKYFSEKLISEKNIPDFCKGKLTYVTEKSIDGIVKRKDRKLKVFDFVIINKRKPVFLIETNFYTTSGTKIGINQNEYTDLLSDIAGCNKKHNKDYRFMWVTDGNYWLTSDGESRYNNLKLNYFRRDYELLNYNLLSKKLPLLIKKYLN